MIVILGRQQLFTENPLTPVIHVLREGRLAVLLDALRMWVVVLAANVLDTAIFGIGLYHAAVFAAAQDATLISVAGETLARGFRDTFVSAIFAGWLIALMLWLLPAAEIAPVGVIIIITYLVGLGGFSHIIAGSAIAFYTWAAGAATLADAFLYFFIPTLIGNIIGGVAFVAALNYAQVVPDD